MNLFLTGTDTGVGKTYTACALVRQLRRDGVDCVGLKPVCCGDRGDAIALHKANEETMELDQINPVWLSTPASPYAASLLESSPIDLNLLRTNCRQALREHQSVIVEGAGGWFVPITRDYFISDLALELRLPVAVVVANRLGALNHALLTVKAIMAQGAKCAGVFLNETQPPSPMNTLITSGNRMILENLLEVPILGELAFGARAIRWWNESFVGSPAVPAERG